MDYEAFDALRRDLRETTERWLRALPGLADAQRELASQVSPGPDGAPDYPLETPVVYNRDLDDIGPGSDIRWLVVADNPGKKEQLARNRRYLVGVSGRQAENFFARELRTDFRTQTAILNKTPVHTPKTVQLKALARLLPEARGLLEESQRYMAAVAPRMAEALGAPIWVMGLSEARKGGLFGTWRDAFAEACMGLRPERRRRIYAFAHFSMGRFAVELKAGRKPGEATETALLRIGEENRRAVFGF